MGSDNDGNEEEEEARHQQPNSPLTMAERLKLSAQKREKELQAASSDHIYVNCDFIYGSAAAAERVWSIAAYILTKNRERMTPQLFEALLFLRWNSDYWKGDQAMVSEAIALVAADDKSARLEELVAANEEQGAMEDPVGEDDDDISDDDD